MKLSVVICTKDRPEELNTVLKTIIQQEREPYEILIIDASLGENNIVEALSKKEELNGIATKIFHTEPGLVSQRNFGLSKLSEDTDLVLFIDDDVELDKEYLSYLIDVFQMNPKVLGATGFIINLPECGFLNRLYRNGYIDIVVRNFFACDVEGRKDLMWLSGCNMAYRKSVFEQEVFDEFFEAYGLGEDLEFSYRVAKKGELAFVPKARLVHHESPTARIGLRRLGKMYVRNKLYIANKHPEYFSSTLLYLFFIMKWIGFFIGGYILMDSRIRERFLGFCDGFCDVLHGRGKQSGS